MTVQFEDDDESQATDEERAVRVFDTLDEGLRVTGVPFDNHTLVRRIVDHIPMQRFEESGGNLRGIRLQGGHDLLFKSGYTTGFESKEEGEAATGATCCRNGVTGVNWLVWSPVNSGRDGGGTRKTVRLQHRCPTCGNVLPAIGLCDFCD